MKSDEKSELGRNIIYNKFKPYIRLKKVSIELKANFI